MTKHLISTNLWDLNREKVMDITGELQHDQSS